MTPRMRQILLGLGMLAAISAAARDALAVPGCPFCAPSKDPFSMRLAKSDVAVEVKWVSLASDKVAGKGATLFEVVMSYHDDKTFKPGTQIRVEYERDGKPGDPFLMLGETKDGEVNWDEPISIGGEYLKRYIQVVPKPEAANRLEFFVKFLEFPDSEICADAYAEFSRATFENVAALAPKMPRKKLREWLASDDPQMRVRLGLYGMMLGLCGDDTDADFLEQMIMKAPEPDQPRFGIDGMMAGYMMIRGESGLKKLMDAKLNDPRAADDLMLIENALVFLWNYCPDRVPHKVVCDAMRRFLDDPKVAAGSVKHLARWKDWQSLDKLIAAYGHEPFDSNFGKQQIVIFALVCEKDGKATSPDALPQSAIKARSFLDGLDPKFVKLAQTMARTAVETSPASKVE